jgi:hypothetical protein
MGFSEKLSMIKLPFADAYFANLSPSKQEGLRLGGVRAVSSSRLECAFASPNLT